MLLDAELLQGNRIDVLLDLALGSKRAEKLFDEIEQRGTSPALLPSSGIELGTVTLAALVGPTSTADACPSCTQLAIFASSRFVIYK